MPMLTPHTSTKHWVEYVRGMPEIKAFNQTADSFRRLSKSITDYTSFVLEYAMGWQNCMPGFTTIIHNIYLLLIPVGIFIGMGAEDYHAYYIPDYLGRAQLADTHV